MLSLIIVSSPGGYLPKIFLFAVAAIFLLFACAPTNDANTIATSVAGTLAEGNPLQTDNQTAEPSLIGVVEGSVCYPSEWIPAMNVFLQPLNDGDPIIVPIAENQQTFSVEVPSGQYIAFAWEVFPPDYLYGGAYSQSVVCGLTVECTDHSLVEFSVAGGETTTGIDICDWYGDAGTLPTPEGVSSPQATIAASGSISGNLSYPSEFIPAMEVVAFNQNSGIWYVLTTAEGSDTYQIDNLPAGQYVVVSYLVGDDYGGGYTVAVPCGLSVECTDHNLLTVEVLEGQVTSEIDPGDWYAPEGSFPANPN